MVSSTRRRAYQATGRAATRRRHRIHQPKNTSPNHPRTERDLSEAGYRHSILQNHITMDTKSQEPQSKKYLASYEYNGTEWIVEIWAYSQADAMKRCDQLNLEYVGEHICTMPAWIPVWYMNLCIALRVTPVVMLLIIVMFIVGACFFIF